jgi:hypothetical protein
LHYHERSLNYDLYHIVINDWVLAPENFNVISLSTRFSMSVPDGGYSRNELWTPKIWSFLYSDGQHVHQFYTVMVNMSTNSNNTTISYLKKLNTKKPRHVMLEIQVLYTTIIVMLEIQVLYTTIIVMLEIQVLYTTIIVHSRFIDHASSF